MLAEGAESEGSGELLGAAESEGSESLWTAGVLAESKVLDPEGGVEEELLQAAGLIRCDLGGCLFACAHF